MLYMGNFAGHIIPGIIFLLYGSWWCFRSIWLHLKTSTNNSSSNASHKKRNNIHPSSSSSFFELKRDHNLSRKSWLPLLCFPHFPLEPILKIFFSSVGLFVEAFLNYEYENQQKHLVLVMYHVRNDQGDLNDQEKLHHITLYSSFFLSGVIDLLSIFLRLPWPTSMLFLSLSFFIEALLFSFHIMNGDGLNTTVHSLLVYVIIVCVVFSLLRLYSATNILINVGLGSGILFQGTWFIQLSYFLFGGFLREDESFTHKHRMFVVASFTWHLVFIAIGNLLLWMLLSLLAGNRSIFKKMYRRRRGRSGFAPGRRWRDTTEEHGKLMVSADHSEANAIELQEIADTCT